MTALEAFATAVGQLDEELRRLTAFDDEGRHAALRRFVEAGRRLGQSDALIRSVVGYAFDQVAGPMVSLRAEALADVDTLLRDPVAAESAVAEGAVAEGAVSENGTGSP